jgi:hypothetical protein
VLGDNPEDCESSNANLDDLTPHKTILGGEPAGKAGKKSKVGGKENMRKMFWK